MFARPLYWQKSFESLDKDFVEHSKEKKTLLFQKQGHKVININVNVSSKNNNTVNLNVVLQKAFS